MKKLTLLSPAKLNLFLFITGRRIDNYHQLQTLFQFLDYSDIITLTSRQDSQINLLTPFPNISAAQNLIVRAAKLLQKTSKITQGVDIEVIKKLPIGGGLGGGSSNAATTLVGLNCLWDLHWQQEKLIEISSVLGADVPIFIYGRSAFAQGIGEQLSPAQPAEKWYLIIQPDVHVSTAVVFSDPQLTRNTPPRSLDVLLKSPFKNDCEKVVRKKFPKIETAFNLLEQYTTCRLTGTGACLFAEFNSHYDAEQVYNKVSSFLPGFIAKGVNISPFYHSLAQQKTLFESKDR